MTPFTKQRALPSVIKVVGGRARLSELRAALEQFPWEKRLHFLQTPRFDFVDPGDRKMVSDPKDILQHPQDIILLASSYQVLFVEKQSTMQMIFDRVLNRSRL